MGFFTLHTCCVLCLMDYLYIVQTTLVRGRHGTSDEPEISVHVVLFSVHVVLCSVHVVLCSVHVVLCSVYVVLFSVHVVLFSGSI